MADQEELYKELERGKVLTIEVEADSRNALLARATAALSRIMVQPDEVKVADRQEIEIVDDSNVEMVHDILGAALNVFRSGFIWRDAEIEERGGPIVGMALGRAVRPGSPSPAYRDQRGPRASVGHRKQRREVAHPDHV